MDSLEKQLQNSLENLAKQISGTIGISVIELESGMALQAISKVKDFDLDVAAAYNAEVVKQKMKAMEALNLKGQSISDFIITLTSQIHIIRFVNEQYIIYFAVDSSASNLAMIKVALSKTSEEIKGLIAGI